MIALRLDFHFNTHSFTHLDWKLGTEALTVSHGANGSLAPWLNVGLWNGLKCHWIMSRGNANWSLCVHVPLREPGPSASATAQCYWWVRCVLCAGLLSLLKPLRPASWAASFFLSTAEAPTTPDSLWIHLFWNVFWKYINETLSDLHFPTLSKCLQATSN